jgi:hypothetical protein
MGRFGLPVSPDSDIVVKVDFGTEGAIIAAGEGVYL